IGDCRGCAAEFQLDVALARAARDRDGAGGAAAGNAGDAGARHAAGGGQAEVAGDHAGGVFIEGDQEVQVGRVGRVGADAGDGLDDGPEPVNGVNLAGGEQRRQVVTGVVGDRGCSAAQVQTQGAVARAGVDRYGAGGAGARYRGHRRSAYADFGEGEVARSHAVNRFAEGYGEVY